MFENITRVAARVGLHLSKSSPQLLAVGGVVSIAAGAVLLVRGALKSSETLEDFKKDLELIDQVAEEKPDQYSKEDRLRDTTIITMRYLQPLAKHLLPGIALIAVGTGALLGGHQILSKRNAALAAAFKATEKAYNEYRKRVADALGEREELSFRAATEDELSRETPPDGQEVDAAKAALERTSPYAKFFDESSEAWSKDVSSMS